MKKIIVLIFMSFLIISCWKKEIENNEVVIEDNNSLETISYEKISINKNDIEKERNEITLDDIDSISFDYSEPKNELLKIWKKFNDNLNSSKKFEITENINWWIEFENLEKEIEKVPEELKRNFTLELEILDYKTNKAINNWKIFVNQVKLWDFKNGKFEKDFSWIKWIEKFSIMVRAEWYGDWFITLNSINSEWSYLVWKVYLKELNFNETIKLTNKELKLEDNDIILKIKPCQLINNSWECHRWDVKAKINFITANDVNNSNTSLNMKAITKEGEIVYLQSGWMAFTDFITNTWEILQLKKGEKIEITYKVDKQTILDMENEFYGWNKKNGYWLYDKNKNIWLEKEAEIILDKENKTWTAIVSEIY